MSKILRQRTRSIEVVSSDTGSPPQSGSDETRDEVGYKRPPKEGRFKKGHKGNPWGRKGKPKPETDFIEESMNIVVDGCEKFSVPREKTIDYFLFMEAQQGNVSAIKLLDARYRARKAERAMTLDQELSPDKIAALERAVLRRVRERDQPDEEKENLP